MASAAMTSNIENVFVSITLRVISYGCKTSSVKKKKLDGV
jgi:hypothetical protein